MATFFSLYTSSPSLSLLLQLLLLTTGALFLQTNAAPLADICRQTKQPPRCLRVLGHDPSSQTATLLQLGLVAISTVALNAEKNRINVHFLALYATDTKMKILYKRCENHYFDALDALQIAPQFVINRRYGELRAAARLVRRSVHGCAAALKKHAGLKKDNEDVAVVAQAIAVIAKNLSR